VSEEQRTASLDECPHLFGAGFTPARSSDKDGIAAVGFEQQLPLLVGKLLDGIQGWRQIIRDPNSGAQ
jgi:hypothetical protein